MIKFLMVLSFLMVEIVEAAQALMFFLTPMKTANKYLKDPISFYSRFMLNKWQRG